MVAVKPFAAGCVLWLAAMAAAGAHEPAASADTHAAHAGMSAAA